MTRVFAWVLSILMLLQTFSRELLVVDYQVHKERITELFCVNKARPQLQCNGKCHLAKQLRKASEAEKKAPAGVTKVKYEVLAPVRLFFGPPAWQQVVLREYAGATVAAYFFTPMHSIFHPPSLLV
ncbi:MAG TPA: hypothetical protein VF598_12565 [Hymenobacter sp.]